ncbi:DUF6303 family protein [Streptomyces sp. NBC_01236]|uniref:DUF6303 family protein n=1 Tax=Streptomyces sp. NBC_01236 TaxID=2903789 RepID=UPI002E0FC9FC|nr:DUF6303 family protein [Streptomyces sp. NBC_01236]
MPERDVMVGMRAFVAWTTHFDPAGGWSLHIADRDGELSPCVVTWDTVAPPSLLARYDALADLGFAVVEGGTEAWTWKEYTADEGTAYFMGETDIRPLLAEDLPT